MLTVGVDLAAAPAGTAIATIRWSSGPALVTRLHIGADDQTIIGAIAEAATGSGKAGIDCPLGWPSPFVEFRRAYRAMEAAATFAPAARHQPPFI